VRDAAGSAKCLLIDFDYAGRVNSELKASFGVRTVSILIFFHATILLKLKLFRELLHLWHSKLC
jgi:hypothetical protein